MENWRARMLVLVAALMAGCASVNPSPTTELLAVQAVTMRAIEGGPQSKRPDVARHIVHVTHEAAQWLTDADANLAALQARVTLRIGDERLSPSDQKLAEALVSSIVDFIRPHLGAIDDLFSPEQKTFVLSVLSAVEQAAMAYVQP